MVRNSATHVLRGVALLCALLGLIPFANILTHGAAVPWWQYAVPDWLFRGSAVVALAGIIAVFADARLDRLIDVAKGRLLAIPPRTFAITVAAVAFAGAALLAWYCFAGQPFSGDEMAQEWHARILLGGRLSATAERAREFFNTAPVLDRDGRWFSQYPVGGPAFIAVGLALKAAPLVNPALFAVTTWALYRFIGVVFDDLTARTTTLLFLLTPMVLIMAASQMSHIPALAFTMIALLSLARWERLESESRQLREALFIGLAVGVIAIVRPLDAFLVALVIGAFQLWQLRENPRRWRSLATEVVAVLIPVTILLLVNSRTTGRPLLFGYEALNGPEHAWGFHMDPNGELHTARHAVVLMSGYLMRLSRFLFEWPVPAVLVIVGGLTTTRRPTRWDVVLAALIALFLLAYGGYWFDGFFDGPRFLFTAVPAFVYFAIRAPTLAVQSGHPWIRRTGVLLLPLCVAASWLGPGGISSARDRVVDFRTQRTKLKTNIERQARRAGIHNALVFVNDGWRGRLQARLRVLGVTQFRAERILNSLDACALQTALDAEDTLVARSDAERAERVIARARSAGAARIETGMQADQRIALVPGTTPTPICLAEFQRDTAGTIPFPLFLAAQRIGADGRVGGDIVFARDLGPRNGTLRERFGSRSWYRYRVGRSLEDTSIAFVPYR